MTQISIAHLLITNHVADKLWSHGIVAAQLCSMLFGRHVIVRNRAERAAPYLLIWRVVIAW